MTAATTSDDFLRAAEPLLVRAYAGTLGPGAIGRATAAAAAFATDNPRRLRRVDNPVGTMYRAGLTGLHGPATVAASEATGPGQESPFAARPGEPLGATPELSYEDRGAVGLAAAMAALARERAEAVWLVRACHWSNVQAGAAMGREPGDVGEMVRAGMAELAAVLDLSQRRLVEGLVRMADQREAEAAAYVGTTTMLTTPTPPSGPALTTTPAVLVTHPDRPAARPRLLAAAGMLALAAMGTGLVVQATRDAPPIEGGARVAAAAEPDGPPDAGVAMAERPLATVAGWDRPVDDHSLPGTFALAELGADTPIQVADGSRAGAHIVLPDGTATTPLAQLADEEGTSNGNDARRRSVMDGDAWRIAYVDGTGTLEGRSIAWISGTVEAGGRRFVFAHNVDLPVVDGRTGEVTTATRLDAIVELLDLAGIRLARAEQP